MPRVPRTSARNAQNVFCKVLSRVDPQSRDGFGWEGQFAKPGADIPDAGRLVVLECAGATGLTASGARAWGHNRSEFLYVLWSFDGTWHELGRALSTSWHWTLDLGPLAIRALADARGPDILVLPSLEAVTRRLRELIDAELVRIDPCDRWRVLGVLHDQFACSLAALAGD